jgi:hypothetical protein
MTAAATAGLASLTKRTYDHRPTTDLAGVLTSSSPRRFVASKGTSSSRHFASSQQLGGVRAERRPACGVPASRAAGGAGATYFTSAAVKRQGGALRSSPLSGRSGPRPLLRPPSPVRRPLSSSASCLSFAHLFAPTHAFVVAVTHFMKDKTAVIVKQNKMARGVGRRGSKAQRGGRTRELRAKKRCSIGRHSRSARANERACTPPCSAPCRPPQAACRPAQPGRVAHDVVAGGHPPRS